MKTYNLEAFEILCLAVRQDDDQRAWFSDHACPELWEFWMALEGDEKAFKWLMSNHFPELAAIVDSMNDNDTAKKWLLMNRLTQLAAFVDATQGSQRAISFLLQSNETGWMNFAREIYLKNKKKDKNIFRSIFNFGNPYG